VEDPSTVGAVDPARLLTDLIGQFHDASYGTYGQPGVRAELQRTHGLLIGHNTVALLMQRAGLSGLPLRRRAKRVPSQETVTDLVKRQFTADGPNRLWVTDITEHPTREGYACEDRIFLTPSSGRGITLANAAAVTGYWPGRLQLNECPCGCGWAARQPARRALILSSQ
jgi:hypothetical protein